MKKHLVGLTLGIIGIFVVNIAVTICLAAKYFSAISASKTGIDLKIFTAFIHADERLFIIVLIIFICLLTTAFFIGIYLYLNHFIPISKIKAFLDSFENDKFIPITTDKKLGFWNDLFAKLNKINAKVSEVSGNISLLFSISKSLSSSIEINEVSDKVLNAIQSKYEDVSCAIVVPSEDGFLKIRNHRNLSLDFVNKIHIRPGEGLEGRSFKENCQITVNDYNDENLLLNTVMLRQERISSFIHTPLTIDGKCMGVLSIYSKNKDYFDTEKINGISIFAEYLSIGLRNTKLYEKVSESANRLGAEINFTTKELMQTNSRLIQKAREMKALSDIAAFAASKVNIHDIIKMISDRLHELISIENTGFIFYSKSTGLYFPYEPFLGIKMPEGNEYQGFRLEENEYFEKAIIEKQPVVINDVEKVKKALPMVSRNHNLQSLILVPLFASNKNIGVMAAVNKHGLEFNENDKNLLMLVADRISGIIENVFLYQEVQKRVQDLSTMQEISSTISREPVLDNVIKSIIAVTRNVFNADLCEFVLYDVETNMLVTQKGAYFTGGEDVVLKRISAEDKDSLTAEVFRNGKEFISPDASLDPQIKNQDLKYWDIRSLMLVPLKSENGVMGVLVIGKHKPNCFDINDLSLSVLIAKQSSIIIDNARLYQSNKKTKDDLENLNRVKNEFLSVVSHELKTPITAIKGFVKIVLNGDTGELNNQQKQFLHIADQSIDRLINLISELLDISRIESGNMSLKMERINCREFVDDILRKIPHGNYGKVISCKNEISKDIPLVFADKDRLYRVFENLIVNAVKFTPDKGNITIYASDKGDYVQFGVRDTGIGIEKNDLEKIFDKFYRVDTPFNRTIIGAGLGLSIVKSIIDMHGGKIWVESFPGKGSDFQFMIPRYKSEIHDFGTETVGDLKK